MKYYGTFGPSCCEKELFIQLLEMGMTGMRLNLSHSSLEKSREWIESYREAQKESGHPADLLIDLKGPELRIGALDGTYHIRRNDMVVLEEPVEGKEQTSRRKGKTIHAPERRIPVPGEVLQVIVEGQELLLNDGTIRLTATEIVKGKMFRGDAEEKIQQVVCIAQCEGEISSGKSIALPGVSLALPTLTRDDVENLNHAKEFGVTEVMLPFVRGKEDIENLRTELRKMGLEELRIFAKIENMEGVDALDEIIPCADVTVIARGDLGNAVPLWQLPTLQKQIAKKCREQNADFMVVTQLLHSMQQSPVPTRAEVSDIYNAVLDGAASLMITGETAAGRYPAEAMEYLIRTAKEAEREKAGEI
ncbi:MAG: pyruvate kinase [Hespellia sp.]|nr:pyruvate kinase [Hespellia sp.]